MNRRHRMGGGGESYSLGDELFEFGLRKRCLVNTNDREGLSKVNYLKGNYKERRNILGWCIEVMLSTYEVNPVYYVL